MKCVCDKHMPPKFSMPKGMAWHDKMMAKFAATDNTKRCQCCFHEHSGDPCVCGQNLENGSDFPYDHCEECEKVVCPKCVEERFDYDDVICPECWPDMKKDMEDADAGLPNEGALALSAAINAAILKEKGLTNAAASAGGGGGMEEPSFTADEMGRK